MLCFHNSARILNKHVYKSAIESVKHEPTSKKRMHTSISYLKTFYCGLKNIFSEQCSASFSFHVWRCALSKSQDFSMLFKDHTIFSGLFLKQKNL